MIGVVVGIGIILYSIFSLGEKNQLDVERQAWLDEMNDMLTDCNILEKTGGSPNEVQRCILGFIKNVRQDCMKHASPETCEEFDSIIDKYDLRDIFP